MRSTEIFKENIKILKPAMTKKVADKDPAREALHYTMTHLLREILDEDSTIPDLSGIRRGPYADALVQKVHKEFAMPHDVRWEKLEKVTWADIKSRSPNYVIIQGQDGMGAVKWNGSKWEAMLSSKEGITRDSDASINTLFKEIKERIGKITAQWGAIGQGRQSYRGASDNRTGEVDKKRSQRQARREVVVSPNTLDPNAGSAHNTEVILRKLRPVYMRYLEQAIADVKGVVGMALKNDSYQKVKQKLEILTNLQNVRQELIDNPDAVPGKIKERLRPALYLTASHYYPDETGNFALGVDRYGRGQPTHSRGPNQVIADIASGDQKKLITLMNYLKQSLLHP
jgi:hypothetical protein